MLVFYSQYKGTGERKKTLNETKIRGNTVLVLRSVIDEMLRQELLRNLERFKHE